MISEGLFLRTDVDNEVTEVAGGEREVGYMVEESLRVGEN